MSCALLPCSTCAMKCEIGSQNLARLLSTTDTGGDDLIVTARWRKNTCQMEASLWFSTIFTNFAFYLHYRVLISMGPLFVQMLIAIVWVKPSRLHWKDVKYKVLWPHSCSWTSTASIPLTLNLYYPGITVHWCLALFLISFNKPRQSHGIYGHPVFVKLHLYWNST